LVRGTPPFKVAPVGPKGRFVRSGSGGQPLGALTRWPHWARKLPPTSGKVPYGSGSRGRSPWAGFDFSNAPRRVPFRDVPQILGASFLKWHSCRGEGPDSLKFRVGQILHGCWPAHGRTTGADPGKRNVAVGPSVPGSNTTPARAIQYLSETGMNPEVLATWEPRINLADLVQVNELSASRNEALPFSGGRDQIYWLGLVADVPPRNFKAVTRFGMGGTH